MSKKKIFDCVVIGAGVVGASIFNKIIRVGKSCLIIDKASDVATGASKANSGLIHAGYDPKPGTLKAKLNVRGNKLFSNLAKRLGIKFHKCGAMVVGDDKKSINALYKRGLENGVEGLSILDAKQTRERVSQIDEHIKYALFAENAYVVSPYLLTITLTEEGILNGGEIALEEDIVEINKQNEVFEIKTKKSVFYAKQVVNSTASGYNEIANLLGSEKYDLELRRGEYFVFDKAYKFEVPCTIFPLPTKLGKGVLVTPTVDGNFLVGPTSQESDERTVITREGLEEIKTKSKFIINSLNFKNAIRQFSGVRVICGDDFIIEKSKKVGGVINLVGICSPGLSSAPAIAEMVVDLLGFGLKERKNLKKIEPYKFLKDYPISKQKELINQNADYKSVVCKCENITKADILFALRRPLKINSVDGVKRRTNAGMGRCQGGFCFSKVVQLISQERKIPYEKVLKENRGSEVAIGNLREVEHD